MRKIVIIATREFLETVRTKMFVISVVLMPVLILAFVLGTGYISKIAEKEELPARTIALIDHSGLLAEALQKQIDEHNKQNPLRRYVLKAEGTTAAEVERVRARAAANELYAYVVVPQAAIDGDASCELGRVDTQMKAGRTLRRMVTEAVVAVRFGQLEPPLDRDFVKRLERKVTFRELDLQTGTEQVGDTMTRVLTPFAFMFLMWMGTLGISHGLLTSVIEEKSSRVVEVLLSAVSPTELMAGKILGMSLVGVLLISIWGGVGLFAADARGMSSLITGMRLTYVVLYFIPGFLFAAGLMAGIGAACNTLKEAQSMTFPQSLLTMVPMIMWFYLTEYPNSVLSIIISYVPPITPYVMILRICADPHTPVWQIVTTLAVLWAAVFGVIWAAGKVFRVGVLMYGKPPSPRELLRWLRYP